MPRRWGLLGTGSVWKRHEIHDFFTPLPTKRFVALLNWPPSSDAKTTPLVLGVIDSMVNTLSRAEASDRNFFVACQSSLTEMNTPQQVSDVCESLGANLVLGTSAFVTPDGIRVVLQLILKESSQVLRWRSLEVSHGQQFTLPTLATLTAAHMLNVASVTGNVTADQGDTKNAEALAAFQAAEALLKEPNYSGVEAAISQYKVALEADSNFANAYAGLSTSYFLHYVVHHDAASLLLARGNAERALALDPYSVGGHSAIADVYQASGDMPQALREIAKALAPDPTNSRIAVYQGQMYFEAKRWQEAEDCFNRILRARPNYWYAYNELGNAYNYQGKYKLAVEAYQAAMLTGTRVVFPALGAAQMLFFLGDLDGAAAAGSRRVFSIAPHPFAYQIQADIMLVRNKLKESLRAALEATKMDPAGGYGMAKAGGRLRSNDAERKRPGRV